MAYSMAKLERHEVLREGGANRDYSSTASEPAEGGADGDGAEVRLGRLREANEAPSAKERAGCFRGVAVGDHAAGKQR